MKHLSSRITLNTIDKSVTKINSIYKRNAGLEMFYAIVKLKKKLERKIVKGHISFEYDPNKEQPLTVKVVNDG